MAMEQGLLQINELARVDQPELIKSLKDDTLEVEVALKLDLRASSEFSSV